MAGGNLTLSNFISFKTQVENFNQQMYFRLKCLQFCNK